MMVIVLQWNARSLISTEQEFKKYISSLVEKPHLICIQETWLKPQLDFVIPGYSSVRNDRELRQGGGVATFIQTGIGFKIERIGQDDESIAVRLWTGKEQVLVVNFYNPGNRLSLEFLEGVWGHAHGKIIWCGDFNSHNGMWGSTATDANGDVLEQFIESKSLVCINDGSGTRYNCINNTECSGFDVFIKRDGE